MEALDLKLLRLSSLPLSSECFKVLATLKNPFSRLSWKQKLVLFNKEFPAFQARIPAISGHDN